MSYSYLSYPLRREKIPVARTPVHFDTCVVFQSEKISSSCPWRIARCEWWASWWEISLLALAQADPDMVGVVGSSPIAPTKQNPLCWAV